MVASKDPRSVPGLVKQIDIGAENRRRGREQVRVYSMHYRGTVSELNRVIDYSRL